MKNPISKKEIKPNGSTSQPFFKKNNSESFFSKSSVNKNPFFSAPTIQTKLSIGSTGDKYEKEADSIADKVVNLSNNQNSSSQKNTGVSSSPLATKIQRKENEEEETIQAKSLMMKSKGGKSAATPALAAQLKNTKGNGSPLSNATNQFMSNAIGADFGNVKIHTGSDAVQMNEGLNARAFTHGSDIYFNKGQFNPDSSQGKHLLAHELTHVVQQGKGQQIIQRQTRPPSVPTPQPRRQRQDVVYVMGAQSDRFYSLATRFFRARIPNATFVLNLRNLSALLTHLTTTFNRPLGNIFIVSHANEDGTLSFSLDSSDTDNRLSAVELRNELNNAATGISTLSTVGNQVDSRTRIRIKGCDLGRNQQIVELFDRAFNGQGTVTAPTHEQVYSYDSRDARTGSRQAMTDHMRQFESTLPPLPPAPTRVDRSLRGDVRREAQREFQRATIARRQAQSARRITIRNERRRYNPTAQRLGQIAGTQSSLSGPMFQRPGTTRFTADELRPQIDRLYSHLSATQRASLATRLVARDRRNQRLAHRQGVFRQRGQRQYRYENAVHYQAPSNLREARRSFASNFRQNRFIPANMSMRILSNGHYEFTFTGRIRARRRRGTPVVNNRTLTITIPVDSNQSLINQLKAQINNPEKFTWRVTEQTRRGRLTKTVIRERVVCYLHHGSLNASRNNRFNPAESDRRFYATSNFTPPTP